jgi:flagellar protein FliJ
MTTKFRLKAVHDLAQQRSEDATVQLGALNSEAAKAQAKLNLLLQYRDEYHARYRTAVQQDLHSASWQNFRDFLDKLDQAIEQQRAALNVSRDAVQKGRVEWQSTQRDVRAFDMLAERHNRAEAERLKRIDQRVTDEIASRKHTSPKR